MKPKTNGSVTPTLQPVVMPAKGKIITEAPKNVELKKIKGVATKIAENMDQSLGFQLQHPYVFSL